MRLRESVGIWIALVILGAVAALAYRSIDATADTLGWVEGNHKVLQQLEGVSGAYARAATARRAYVVLGDDSQLSERSDLDARMAHSVDVLRTSLADDAILLDRVDSYERLLHERISNLETAVERRRTEGSAGETAEGLAITARVRTAREGIESEVNRRLASRDALTRRDVARTKLAEVMGTGGSFAILLLAFGRLRQEIGRRRRSEHALLSSERFLDSIVENIPDMLFVKEARELRFERFNRAGEELLGVDRKDLFRKNDFDFFPREQAEAFQARDRETLTKGVAVDIPEEPIETKRGTRWLHTKKVPIKDEEGTARYLLGISEDITERRLAAAALKTAKETAEAANKELEAFSYSVAHDLRAPLRSIGGFSQALEEDCGDQLDANGIAHLGRIRSSAHQMGQLIDGLLGLSRLTRSDLVREKVDLTRMAKQTGARLRDAHPEREVEWIVHEGLVGEGDARLLSSALDNLIGNAWKFTARAADARIEFRADITDTETVFLVKDNGAGFDMAHAGALFQPFQRLHSEADFPGTGIGLATVRRIVDRHGGRIWAEGTVGRGATVFFTVPISRARG